MNLFKYILLVATTVFIASCSEKQARKPISQTSGTFMKESIDRNKKLNEQEKIAYYHKTFYALFEPYLCGNADW